MADRTVTQNQPNDTHLQLEAAWRELQITEAPESERLNPASVSRLFATVAAGAVKGGLS